MERAASQLRQQLQEAEYRRQKQLRVGWFSVRGNIYCTLNGGNLCYSAIFFFVEFKTLL